MITCNAKLLNQNCIIMNEIRIEKATKNDSGIILACIKGLAEHVGQSDMVTATKEAIENHIFSDSSHVEVLIAYMENKPAGFILYYITFSTFKASFGLYIEDLFVFPEFRERRIGSKLFQHVIETGRKQNFSKVEWYVNNKNKEALEFYKQFDVHILDYKSINYIKL